ncbi:MAG TPA: hypothetical protein PK668_02405 [Myxococcota bacterium]|nr:hypothetical protein [Myxococcota bacterium]HRY94580.1 hypothetical protein [Myxococcota bacterium]
MTARLFTRWLAAFGLAVLLTGCVAMGWRFGPGFPCSSGTMFAAPPVVEHRADGYYLTWTQGDYPFYFLPNYQAMDGRLVFAMVATASSGNLAGRHREIKIEGDDHLEALRQGGAVWWEREPEPDGRFVRLEIRESAAADR